MRSAKTFYANYAGYTFNVQSANLHKISDLPLFSSRDVCENKGYRIIAQNSVIPLTALISVFCSKSLT